MRTSHTMMLEPKRVRLTRAESRQLCLEIDGTVYADVRVRRAFPLESPFRYISFFDGEGTEIGMIDDVDALDEDTRGVLLEALDRTYFLPVVEDITQIAEEYGVLRADLETTSGPRQIEIRGYQRSIRPLSRDRAIIEDVDGNRYELRNWRRLPKLTREILGL